MSIGCKRSYMKDIHLPIPGEILAVDGHPAFIITPEKTSSRPWVWYAPTLPDLPGPEETWMFERFLSTGFTIAGIDIGESYGSPEGRGTYSVFYRKLVESRLFSEKPCLLARSRGALMLYNWAVENPTCVSCIAGIYPVCNLRSIPALKDLCMARGMAELSDHNPVDHLESLANAGVPIFHIHGDIDTVVPLETNSIEMMEKYHQLEGSMTVRVVQGKGHDLWPGWFQCQELVDFVIHHGKREA